MKPARSLYALPLILGGVVPLHAQNIGQMTAPIRWNGVEVITNDFDSVEQIRRIAAFPENAILPMSDPVLREVCASVRSARPDSKIVCTPVIGEGADGVPNAWYVIEVDIPSRRSLRCLDAPPISAGLTSLLEEWKRELSRAVMSGSPTRDYVNDARYLDYESPSLSKLAARLRDNVKDSGRELESAGAGCEPRARENAFYLMSFSGDPDRYLSLAAYHMLDEDPGAANAATRFVLTFADFIRPAAAVRIAEVACTTLDGGLTARNKSLSLLSKLKQRGVIKLDQLPDECQRQIGNIARTSRAGLVAVPAQELVGGTDE